jgi:hypothetical protein
VVGGGAFGICSWQSSRYVLQEGFKGKVNAQNTRAMEVVALEEVVSIISEQGSIYNIGTAETSRPGVIPRKFLRSK